MSFLSRLFKRNERRKRERNRTVWRERKKRDQRLDAETFEKWPYSYNMCVCVYTHMNIREALSIHLDISASCLSAAAAAAAGMKSKHTAKERRKKEEEKIPWSSCSNRCVGLFNASKESNRLERCSYFTYVLYADVSSSIDLRLLHMLDVLEKYCCS